MGTCRLTRQGGPQQGGSLLHPLPRSAKLLSSFGRAAAATGEQDLGRSAAGSRVLHCFSVPGRSQASRRPVALGPEGMRQSQGSPLPGLEVRASVSGECGTGQ